MYHHEIPGGQLSNLRQQAIALGLGEKFEQIEDMYAAADRILGRLVKVTPSSKVVGDLSLHLVALGADPDEFARDPRKFDVPDSCSGSSPESLGTPPGGWPLRTRALQGREVDIGVGELSADDRKALDTPGRERQETLNRLLFPGPAAEFGEVRRTYGDLSVLDTVDYLYGLRPGTESVIELDRGVRLIASLEAVGAADERGIPTVMCTLNGQLRPVWARDRAIATDVPETEKADPANPGHVPVPFAGVVTPAVAEGDEVEAGQTVATIEAMKLEASITAPIPGRVARLVIAAARQVEAGDLIAVIDT